MRKYSSKHRAAAFAILFAFSILLVSCGENGSDMNGAGSGSAMNSGDVQSSDRLPENTSGGAVSGSDAIGGNASDAPSSVGNGDVSMKNSNSFGKFSRVACR